MPPTSDVSQSEFVIELSDVERKLSRINMNKASGPDGLPNWILREFCTQLSVQRAPSSTHQSEKALCLLVGKKPM